MTQPYSVKRIEFISRVKDIRSGQIVEVPAWNKEKALWLAAGKREELKRYFKVLSRKKLTKIEHITPTEEKRAAEKAPSPVTKREEPKELQTTLF